MMSLIVWCCGVHAEREIEREKKENSQVLKVLDLAQGGRQRTIELVSRQVALGKRRVRTLKQRKKKEEEESYSSERPTMLPRLSGIVPFSWLLEILL